MEKIVIIDTSIDASKLRCSTFSSYNLVNEWDCVESEALSHGTMVAMVFDYLVEQYELVNIQIFASKNQVGEKVAGDIRILKEAFDLCLQILPDIVILSAGSTILSDSRFLYKVVKRVSEQSVIVAALDNRNLVTVPASYPFVIGVKAEDEVCKHPGEVKFLSNNLWGINAYANCKFDFVKAAHFHPGNSLAVPVVAAKLCSKKTKHINIELNNKKLGTLSRDFREIDYIDKMREIPLVLIKAKEKTIKVFMREIVDEFFERYGIQSMALTDIEMEYDIRIVIAKKVYELEKAIKFLRFYCKTDIIIAAISEENYSEATFFTEWDLKIVEEIDGLKFIYDQKYVKKEKCNIVDEIYRILA